MEMELGGAENCVEISWPEFPENIQSQQGIR